MTIILDGSSLTIEKSLLKRSCTERNKPPFRPSRQVVLPAGAGAALQNPVLPATYEQGTDISLTVKQSKQRPVLKNRPLFRFVVTYGIQFDNTFTIKSGLLGSFVLR